MRRRTAALIAASAVATGVVASTAMAAGPPPPPKATNGHQVQLVASGLHTPTSFAFGGGNVFEGDGGAASNKVPNGGVFVLKNGTGTLIPGSPQFVAGLAWHDGRAVRQRRLRSRQPVRNGSCGSGAAGTAPRSPSRRRSTRRRRSSRASTASRSARTGGCMSGPTPACSTATTMGRRRCRRSCTTSCRSTATARASRCSRPESASRGRWHSRRARRPRSCPTSVRTPGAKNPPDFILRVQKGDNYGFPTCNWTSASNCTGYA